MAANELGLYELLTPYFLVGFTVPEHIDHYLSTLRVQDLHTAHDDVAVVYSGVAAFDVDGAAATRVHRDPNGALLRWEDVEIGFRLTVPRDGAAFVKTAVTNTAQPLPALDSLFDRLGPVDEAAATPGPLTPTGVAPTDYPGVRFRLELLVSSLTFHLGPDWRPGTMNPTTHRVVLDQARANEDVVIVLPKIVMRYEQGDDLTTPPVFTLDSWGSSGFDAPADLLEGELVRMDPPLALHKDGRFAFGFDQILLDLSPDHTPPEILAFFGTDEAWEGVYVKSARVYYADSNKDLGINVGVRDLLISLTGEVSLEAQLDVLGPETDLAVRVRLFEGSRELSYTKGRPRTGQPASNVQDGSGRILDTGEVQLVISGGIPPYTVSVQLGTDSIWDVTTRSAPISPGAPGTLRTPGTATLHVSVVDSGPTSERQSYDEEIELTIVAAPAQNAARDGAPSDRPPVQGQLPAAALALGTTSPSPLPAGYGIAHTPATSGTTEQLEITGGEAFTVTVDGVARPPNTRAVTIDVPESSSVAIHVAYDATTSTTDTFHVFFDFGKPDPAHWPASKARYVANAPDPADARFSGSREAGQTVLGAEALKDWATGRTSVTVDGYASRESAQDAAYNLRLSNRRREAARAILDSMASPPADGGGTGHGDVGAHGVHNEIDRVVLVSGTRPTAGAVTIDATLSRGARPAPPTPPATPATPSVPGPAPDPNAKPPTFRRLGFRVRIERNSFALLEISGELDFETEMEHNLRQQTGEATADLQLAQLPAASANPNPRDGIVDFVVTVTHDQATHAWTESLALGAHPDDIDGLLRMLNPRGTGPTTAGVRLKDALGAILVLAPVINAAAGALATGQEGDWVVLAGAVALPTALGATGVFQTTSVTLYGGELKFRQVIPPGTTPATFTDAGVTFDYGVEFGIHIDELGINTTKPLKVRYRALGFNLNFGGGVTYQPIFDTSKGYELDLSDPGLFNLPSPLGDLLKIFAVRLVHSSLTLELDLGLKVDLGVVTVDRFKVKWPIDPLGAPSILPSGARINIPGTLVGSGYVDIIEPPSAPSGTEPSGGGFEGSLDVSLVPIKLRISASLGVRTILQPPRKATAVFAGLIVDFPAPIPLGQSGIGIYGFSGLFAMHYKRLEPAAVPGDSIPPALHWLVSAKGEPAKLVVDGTQLWGPELDRWSFGVGVALGTVDGGFLVNLRGMFVLELPGPRILIFTKILIVQPLPDLKPATDLVVGILGVVDLDFNLKQLTVGVLINFEIEEIVSVQIPTELYFKLDDLRNWHLHLGTFQAPATAWVLNIVRGYGYFMISGTDIVGWPGRGQTRTLPGIAVAAGIGASVVLGDEGIGLYLRVAAGADLGVAFSPFFMVGEAYLDGELHLFIVGIEAHGTLHVEAPDPTYIHGEICGKVDFFFFSVEGCVGLTIGSDVRSLPAPPLVRNVFLQSHAPVLTAGQGGDRPIDASLGDATTTGSGPTVPIDTVPVVQFHGSPLISSSLSTFTTPIATSPTQTPGGWIDVGGDRKVKYELTELSLSPALPAATAKPKATWRPDAGATPTGAKTNIDLALFSSVPVQGERAIERSSDLDELVRLRWENLCDPVAPAVCVLWTFCGQPLGPSGEGWSLSGTAEPDPPGTTRQTPADTTLYVEEPTQEAVDSLLGPALALAGQPWTRPAEVIGPNVVPPAGDGQEPPVSLVCHDFGHFKVRPLKNPLRERLALFLVRDHGGNALPQARVGRQGKFRGLDVGFRTEIALRRPSRIVELTLVHFAQPAIATAYDAAGAVVARAAMTVGVRTPETLRLSGGAIARVVVDAPQDEALLVRFCVARERVPERPERADPPPTDDPRRERLARSFLDRSYARAVGAFEAERAAAVADAGAGAAAAAPLLAGLPGMTRAVAGTAATATAAAMSTHGDGGARLDVRCFRALELPYRSKQRPAGGFKLPAKAKAYAASLAESQWVTLHTGPATRVTLLLGVAKALTGADGVRVRQLDASGGVVADDAVSALSPTVVATAADLPPKWIDPADPWRNDVAAAVTFLASFGALTRLLVEVEPDEKTDRIQIVVPSTAPRANAPAVLLSVIEACRRGEAERVETEEAIKSGELEALIGYLNGGADVPLLEKNQSYTLSVKYIPTSRAADGTETSEPTQTQQFKFKTDASPPERLDPWVLATTPDHEEEFVFFEDPVRIVFNDVSAVQLYKAYGKSLKAVLRAADGVPIPSHTVQNLDEVPGDVTSPYREYLEAIIAAGWLPCTGTIDVPTHSSFTVPVPLRPLMGYTLDVELDPAGPAPVAGKPSTPLYRRSFKTSQFASAAALVEDVKQRRIRHRGLTALLTGLPAAGSDGTATAADRVIQDALRAAGEQALPAPEEGSITVYWAPRGLPPAFAPHAILIDSVEPLWRTRYAPVEETVPGQSDPAYKRIVPGTEVALRLVEQGGSHVDRFVRSPSGTRTLVLLSSTFAPAATGTTVTIAAQRPASTLFAITAQTNVVVALPFLPKPPWELDDG